MNFFTTPLQSLQYSGFEAFSGVINWTISVEILQNKLVSQAKTLTFCSNNLGWKTSLRI